MVLVVGLASSCAPSEDEQASRDNDNGGHGTDPLPRVAQDAIAGARLTDPANERAVSGSAGSATVHTGSSSPEPSRAGVDDARPSEAPSLEDLRTRQAPSRPFDIDTTGQRMTVEQVRSWWKPLAAYEPSTPVPAGEERVWYSVNAPWEKTNPATCRCGVGLIIQHPPADIAHGNLSSVLAGGGAHITAQRFTPDDRSPRANPFFRKSPTDVSGRPGFTYAVRRGDNPGVNVSFRWTWWEEVAADGTVFEVNVETNPEVTSEDASRQLVESLRSI